MHPVLFMVLIVTLGWLKARSAAELNSMEASYRTAAADDRMHANAWHDLGCLQMDRCNVEGGEAAYRRRWIEFESLACDGNDPRG